MMKELTELPEKWCIRIATSEINDAVNSIKLWKLGNLYFQDTPAYTKYYITFDGRYLSYKDPSYTEITYDQFKRWVLKEPQFEVGKWYKIELESKFNHIFQFNKYCKGNKEVSLKHGFLYNCDKWQTSLSFELENMTDCIEIDLRTITHLLPDNYPDKIKIKETSKEINMKAQPFQISGSKSLLKAIYEELLNMGYTGNSFDSLNVDKYPTILSNQHEPKDLYEFKQITSYLPNQKGRKQFSLPSQYNEVLEFAKAQLDSSLWEKKQGFVTGNWYEYNYNGRIYYMKCSKNHDTDIYYSEYINTLEKSFKVDSSMYSSIQNDCVTFNIITIEEIQQYLPDGHPDKIKPKEYSKGTYIVTLRDKFNGRKDACLTIGKIYEIIKSGGALTCPYINDDNRQEVNFITYEEITSVKWFATKKEAEAFAETLKPFVLPKNWYVVVTKENQRDVSQWRNGGTYILEVDKIAGMHCYTESTNATKEHNPRYSTDGFGEEISTEQFYEYVYKKPDFPKYVKCIDISSHAGGYPYGIALDKYYEVVSKDDCPRCGKNGYILKDVHSGSSKGCSCGYNCMRDDSFISNRFIEVSEEEYNKSLVKTLPFGNLEFTIVNTGKYKSSWGVSCKYGIISYQEIKDMVDYFEKPIKVLGYDMKIENKGKWLITFGCCKGSYTQLKAIYKAFED